MKYFLSIAIIALLAGCATKHPVGKITPEIENLIDNESDRLRAALDAQLINQDKNPSDAIYRKALEHEVIK